MERKCYFTMVRRNILSTLMAFKKHIKNDFKKISKNVKIICITLYTNLPFSIPIQNTQWSKKYYSKIFFTM